MMIEKLLNLLRGKALDPLNPKTRHAIAIVPLLAWVGLGADGLSSSCYGPEQAFLALGDNHHLALFLALATALTVFIIALGYSQIIELFPSGGGGYRVATALLGSKAGLVSGSALLVDYFLTIAVSVASGVDALFSLFPPSYQPFKLSLEITLVVALIILNFRGIKESIKVLLPIFLGFCATHFVLIVYGISIHAADLPALVPDSLAETKTLAGNLGWVFVASLFLRAYSLGGGTYTGLEAVSNNVGSLKEPRVANAKWTMLYLALSLAITAGGIIMLYLLWQAKPVDGQTLNAVVFGAILDHANPAGGAMNASVLAIVLMLEAGLLFVAAQTGFIDGPTVLSNMAVDYWIPRHFRELSSRLVRQNGVVVMGLASLFVLYFTHGQVDTLVVLYSINVFLTFSLSLFGMCVYWLRHSDHKGWVGHFAVSLIGFLVTASILVVTVSEKFFEGGWLTVLVTSLVVGLALLTRAHYEAFRAELVRADSVFTDSLIRNKGLSVPELDKTKPAAIVIVSRHRGASMHAILSAMKFFPNYKNFVFIAVGEIDAESYEGQQRLDDLRQNFTKALQYYVDFCNAQGIAATCLIGFGTDTIKEFSKLLDEAFQAFPHNSIAFSSKIFYAKANFFTKWLHNQTPIELQELQHYLGRQMILLPMRVG